MEEAWNKKRWQWGCRDDQPEEDMRMLKPLPPPVQMPTPAFDSEPLPCLALTVEEAAQVLRLSRCTILEIIGENRLRVVRVGRRILVPVRAVDEFLNATG